MCAVRVLLLTQWFDPEPTFKGLVFARELVKQGFDVEVVTGFPNYPGGRLYPGYRIKFFQREMIDGVKITRVPLFPSHDQGKLGRIFNYVSFAATSLVYSLFGTKKPDVIYAYHPPLTVAICAALVKLFRHVPVVLDIQDIWPDTLRATGMFSNERALKLVSSICNWTYRRVDQLVVLSPGFKSLLVQRSVPAEKIEVIYNWADEAALTNNVDAPPENFPDSSHFRILFAGNMGKAQALNSVLDTANLLQARGSRITFIFVGGGIEVSRLKRQAQDKKLDNVMFFPPVPMAEVARYLNAADALLVHLKQDPLFKITIPSKTQAYMAVGKPILMAVDGDAANLVKDSSCGRIAQSENPESIAGAAAALANMSSDDLKTMEESGRRYYRENLSLYVGTSAFAKIFNRLNKRRMTA